MSRYSRQELFAPIGPEGQARLAQARVLIVGCGALGTHLADFCARAGVGKLTLIDRDVVELSNLQRQSLFSEHDAESGLPKAEAARRRLAAVNSGIELHALVDEFNASNAEALVSEADLVLDGSDNFETRLLVNEACVKLGKPWIYAACVGSRALAMPVIPGQTACLQCVLEGLPQATGETCDSVGVILPAVLAAVSLAATEALKLLVGARDKVIAKLKTVDLWSGERTQIDTAAPRADCEVCVRREFARLSGQGTQATVLCGRDSVQVRPEKPVDFGEIAERLAQSATICGANEFLVRARMDDLELTLFANGRALVHGTADPVKARAFYAKWVGG